MFCPKCGRKEKVFCVAVNDIATSQYKCMDCDVYFEVIKQPAIKEEKEIDVDDPNYNWEWR